VFLSERKAPLSVDGAQKLIERLGVAAKLPFKIHAHMLRHAEFPAHDSTSRRLIWIKRGVQPLPEQRGFSLPRAKQQDRTLLPRASLERTQ
jgi:site-specific recombinase XerC